MKRISRLSCYFLALIPPFLWLWLIYFSDINFPFRDEVDIPGAIILKDAMNNHVHFMDFFKWHNESRKVLPSLILFAIYKLINEWNLKLEMFISISLGILNCFIVTCISWKIPNCCRLPRHAYCLIFSLFYFSPQAYFRWINGYTLHRVLPDTFFLLSILIFASSTTLSWMHLYLYACFSACAQLSFSGGVILWPICFLLILLSRNNVSARKLRICCAFFAMFLLSQYLYFSNPNLSTVNTLGNAAINISEFKASSIISIISYLFAFIATGILHKGGFAMVAALIGLSSFIMISIFMFRIREKVQVEFLILNGALILYPMSLALLAGLGRGFHTPIQSKYILYGSFLPLAIVASADAYSRFYKGFHNLRYMVISALFCLYLFSNFDGRAFNSIKKHIDHISAGKSCIVNTKSEIMRQDCYEFIYPPAKTDYQRFKAVDERLKFLIETNVIR